MLPAIYITCNTSTFDTSNVNIAPILYILRLDIIPLYLIRMIIIYYIIRYKKCKIVYLVKISVNI